MKVLEPWQLIKLKQKYGGLYVIKYEKAIYACRQPTWSELIAQHDVKELYDLSTEETFLELQKQTLVFPEKVEEVPSEQLYMLAEQIAEDIPYTEEELEKKIQQILDNENLYRQIALKLWSSVGGTTLDEFYTKPFQEVLEMFQTMELVNTLMEEQKAQKQPMYVTEQDVDTSQIVKQRHVVKNDIDYSQYLGKPLDEVLKAIGKKGG